MGGSICKHQRKLEKVGEEFDRIFRLCLTFSRLRRQLHSKAIGMTIDLQYLENLTGVETHDCKVSIPDSDEFLALTKHALGWTLDTATNTYVLPLINSNTRNVLPMLLFQSRHKCPSFVKFVCDVKQFGFMTVNK